MKKLVLFLLCLIITGEISFSATNNFEDKLKMIEKETKTYAGENISLNQRLNNAEIYIFGEAKKGDTTSRISNLAKAVGITFDDTKKETVYEIEDNVIANYPVIDKLEEATFNKVYKTENIYKRLDRLETKIFGNTSDLSLDERVSFLEKNVNIKSADKSPQEPEYNYYSPTKAKKRTTNISLDDNEEEKRQAIEEAKRTAHEYRMNKFAKFASTGIQIGGLVLLILAMIL